MSAISKNSPQFKLYQAIFRRNNEAGCLAALNECFPESGTPISFDFRHYTVDGTAIELKSPEDQLKDLFSSLAGVKYLKAMTYLLQAYPQKYGLPRAKDLLFIAITAFCNIRSPDKPYKDFYDLCRQIQITFTSHPLGEDESRVRETFLKFSADFHVIGASLVLAEYPVNRLACVYVRKLEDLESLGINVDDLISETGLLHWIKHSNPLVLENILLKRGWSDTTALIVFGRAVKKNESRLYQLAFQNIEDPNGIFDRVLSRIKVLSDCELGFDYWTNEVPDLISESFCIINACLDSGMKLLPKQKELLCIRLSPSRIKVLVKFK